MKIRTIASITFISLILAAIVVIAASGGTEGKPLAPGRIVAALPAGNGSALALTLHHGQTYDGEMYNAVYAVLLDGDDVIDNESFWLPNDEEPTLAALLSGCNLYLFASWSDGEMARRYWWELPPGYCAGRVGETLLPVVVK